MTAVSPPRMPDEGDPHQRTWMAFGASKAIWGADLVDDVRADLASVAAAIVDFEPVTMLVRPGELSLARRIVDSRVTLLEVPIDDLWIRDTGPTFVRAHGGLQAVDFNFNGWGDKQTHARDARVAAEVSDSAGAAVLSTDLVIEGGALEVDGQGTAIITRSCVLNDNRNPGWTADRVEAELNRLLGITKVVWLPGIAGKDITDGHTDFYARFAGPGRVVAALDDYRGSFDYAVTREHLKLLRQATDAAGRPLEVIELRTPERLRVKNPGPDFAAGYINYYLVNGGLIAPQFGDREADRAAADTLARLFPDREVVPLAIDGIASGGGGIHCSTQQQPTA